MVPQPVGVYDSHWCVIVVRHNHKSHFGTIRWWWQSEVFPHHSYWRWLGKHASIWEICALKDRNNSAALVMSLNNISNCFQVFRGKYKTSRIQRSFIAFTETAFIYLWTLFWIILLLFWFCVFKSIVPLMKHDFVCYDAEYRYFKKITCIRIAEFKKVCWYV